MSDNVMLNVEEISETLWNDIDANNAISLINTLSQYDCEGWREFADEIMHNSLVTEEGNQFLKAIAREIIRDDIDLLKHKINSISEYKYGDFLDYEAHEASRECMLDIIDIINEWWEVLSD